MRPSPRTILRRRALAVLATVALTALLWDLGPGRERDEAGSEPPAAAAGGRAEAQRIARLDREQKVAQLLLVAAGPGERAPEDVGGVLVGADAWPGAEAAASALRRLRRFAGGGELPALVVARQEGGEYRSLRDVPPAARQVAVGDLADPEAAEAWARQAAEALAEHGFDLNLAPVADVATLDSAIADRAFSDDPEIVRRMTAAAIRGCRRGGLACAPSHFPGQGGASGETDLGPATVGLDATTLLERELVPFLAAFDAGAPAVVVSHAFYAAYDPVTPASAAPAVLEGLLRGQAGFEGVAITDDLAAGAIRAGNREGAAAVTAIAAGADMLQLGDPRSAAPVRRALLEALEQGAIPGDRLDEAVGRVLALKRKLGLLAGDGD